MPHLVRARSKHCWPICATRLGWVTPRRAQGQEWVRLEVTPDIEIHLRGQLYGEQLKDFERLADLMRHILLGSEDHE